MTARLAMQIATPLFAGKRPHARACIIFELCGAFHYLSALGYDWHGPAALYCLETGNGTSAALLNGNNLFGVSQQVSGRWQPVKYQNTLHCLDCWSSLLLKSRYGPAYVARYTPGKFIEQLHQCGYNEQKTWLRELQQILAAIHDFQPLR